MEVVKKHGEGEAATTLKTALLRKAVDELLKLENEPVKVLTWISHHMNPELDNRMKQTIRAQHKRHFNAEHQHTRKNMDSENSGLAAPGRARCVAVE
ncbi:hypothetical protein AB6846_27715 [Serratia proteamaculans]